MDIRECHKNILCVDCTDTECLHAGQTIADCPKYHCDNKKLYDCKHCDFMKEHTQYMRNHYRKITDSKTSDNIDNI